jgi:hypothetical protein
MLRGTLSTLTVAVIGFAVVACSGSSGSAVEPNTPAPPVSGSYRLTFLKSSAGGFEPVSSLPFGQELNLRAHVDDRSGRPVTTGTIIFEYCSLNGYPKNDIAQIDEAPIEACADGRASWTPMVTTMVNGLGEATMNFGFVQVTPVIGFRFRYVNQGGGIASGESAPADFMFHP